MTNRRVGTRLRWTASRQAMIVSVLAGSILSGCVAPSRTANDEAQARWNAMRAQVKLRLAQDQFDAGDINAALGPLNEAVRLNPRAAGAEILLAKIQLARGELGAARSTLAQVYRRGKPPAEVMYLRGVLEERAGNSENAFEAYRAALDADPQDLHYVVAVAETMLTLGFPDSVVRWLDQLEESHGDSATVHALRGQAFRAARRYDEAAQAYETAHDFDPGDASLVEARGLCLFWAGRYGAAAETLMNVLEDEPVEVRPSLQLALARCWLEMGDATRAWERLALLAQEIPDSGPLWALMAQAAWAEGNGEAALDNARRAVELEPTNLQSKLLLAALAYRLGKTQVARQAIRPVLEAEPTHALAVRLHEALTPTTALATTSSYGDALRGVVSSLFAYVRRWARESGPAIVWPGETQSVSAADSRTVDPSDPIPILVSRATEQE